MFRVGHPPQRCEGGVTKETPLATKFGRPGTSNEGRDSRMRRQSAQPAGRLGRPAWTACASMAVAATAALLGWKPRGSDQPCCFAFDGERTATAEKATSGNGGLVCPFSIWPGRPLMALGRSGHWQAEGAMPWPVSSLRGHAPFACEWRVNGHPGSPPGRTQRPVGGGHVAGANRLVSPLTVRIPHAAGLCSPFLKQAS